MNQERHWNKIAQKYEGEIFDVFRSDKNGVLGTYFRKHADASHHAIDFGCGVGKAFPYLAPAFASLLAIDISEECLQIAASNAGSNKKITFRRADLTRTDLRLPAADFVFCCNVVMLPELLKDLMMIKNIRKALRPGAFGVVVVPSLESVLFSSWRLIDWYRREGVEPDRIPATEFDYYRASKRDLVQGIIHIDGVPTKHYSEPEIRALFKEAKLEVTALEKIEYRWTSEFDLPPPWMKDPYPWDWLIECKR